MRKNNSTFNCCIGNHRHKFVRERIARLSFHIYVYYLTKFEFAYWEVEENVRREKLISPYIDQIIIVINKMMIHQEQNKIRARRRISLVSRKRNLFT